MFFYSYRVDFTDLEYGYCWKRPNTGL